MASNLAKRAVRQFGFTLIELLIVISILALLMVALLSNFGGTQEIARIGQCRTLLQSLAAAADSYASQRKFGDFPPDNFKDPLKQYVVKADGINAGIESLIAFLARPDARVSNLESFQESFSNTDHDKSDGPLGKLERPDKIEVRDPWGNPIAYFHKRSYKKGSQQYRLGGEDPEDQEVHAWRRKDGSYFNPRTFQLFSAGPDGVYNSEDDIGHNFSVNEEAEEDGD